MKSLSFGHHLLNRSTTSWGFLFATKQIILSRPQYKIYLYALFSKECPLFDDASYIVVWAWIRPKCTCKSCLSWSAGERWGSRCGEIYLARSHVTLVIRSYPDQHGYTRIDFFSPLKQLERYSPSQNNPKAPMRIISSWEAVRRRPSLLWCIATLWLATYSGLTLPWGSASKLTSLLRKI